MWEGEYENRTAQSFYDWGVIAQHFEAMRLLGELTDTMKPIPSMDGQLTLIMGNQAEEQKTSAFTFSQEIIDAVLTVEAEFPRVKCVSMSSLKRAFPQKRTPTS